MNQDSSIVPSDSTSVDSTLSALEWLQAEIPTWGLFQWLAVVGIPLTVVGIIVALLAWIFPEWGRKIKAAPSRLTHRLKALGISIVSIPGWLWKHRPVLITYAARKQLQNPLPLISAEISKVDSAETNTQISSTPGHAVIHILPSTDATAEERVRMHTSGSLAQAGTEPGGVALLMVERVGETEKKNIIRSLPNPIGGRHHGLPSEYDKIRYQTGPLHGEENIVYDIVAPNWKWRKTLAVTVELSDKTSQLLQSKVIGQARRMYDLWQVPQYLYFAIVISNISNRQILLSLSDKLEPLFNDELSRATAGLSSGKARDEIDTLILPYLIAYATAYDREEGDNVVRTTDWEFNLTPSPD